MTNQNHHQLHQEHHAGHHRALPRKQIYTPQFRVTDCQNRQETQPDHCFILKNKSEHHN